MGQLAAPLAWIALADEKKSKITADWAKELCDTSKLTRYETYFQKAVNSKAIVWRWQTVKPN